MLRKSFRGLREAHALVAGAQAQSEAAEQVAQQAITAGKQIFSARSASSAILNILAHSSIEASCHVRALAMPVTMSFRSRLAVALLGAALTPPSKRRRLSNALVARLAKSVIR